MSRLFSRPIFWTHPSRPLFPCIHSVAYLACSAAGIAACGGLFFSFFGPRYRIVGRQSAMAKLDLASSAWTTEQSDQCTASSDPGGFCDVCKVLGDHAIPFSAWCCRPWAALTCMPTCHCTALLLDQTVPQQAISNNLGYLV